MKWNKKKGIKNVINKITNLNGHENHKDSWMQCEGDGSKKWSYSCEPYPIQIFLRFPSIVIFIS